MASYESIRGSPVAALMHNLRERDNYANPDIDQTRSHLNYTLSSNGDTVKECMDHYEHLIKDVYHRGEGTITTAQWVVTAPADLTPEKEREFFECTYDFLNDYFYDGNESRCLLAQVHYDEGGRPHLHYVMVMPEINNPKYKSLESKFVDGIKQTQSHFNVKLSEKQIRDLFKVVQEFEASSLKSRERYAIRDVQDVLGLKRDDARWVFTRIRRLESEKYKKKLQPKDSFLTVQKFNAMHPRFQEWTNAHQLNCTVYFGGTGISLTVKQLKEMTRETGLRLVDNDTYELMQDRILSLETQLQEYKQKQSWGYTGWEKTAWSRD